MRVGRVGIPRLVFPVTSMIPRAGASVRRTTRSTPPVARTAELSGCLISLGIARRVGVGGKNGWSTGETSPLSSAGEWDGDLDAPGFAL